MASRFTSSPFVCVALIVSLALLATRFRSAPEATDPPAVLMETTPGAEVTEGAPPTTREDLGNVPHRVRDHASAVHPSRMGMRLRESATSRRTKD
jgi:hypothetical protein